MYDSLSFWQFKLMMEWYDFRLTYHNLKPTVSSNSLANHEIEQIWIPFVVFENTKDNEATM